MKHLILLLAMACAPSLVKSQNLCDVYLQEVQFNSQTPNPQPILTISNVGIEPITTAQIQWGLVGGTQSIYPFSSSSWGGLLESGETTQLVMPQISVPQGSWSYSFTVINLNNSNPNFGLCVGFDNDTSNNSYVVEIHTDEDGCIDEDSNGFCDPIVTNVTEIENNRRIRSIEYFDIMGRKVQFEDMEINMIHVKKINFEDGQFEIEKIIKI